MIFGSNERPLCKSIFQSNGLNGRNTLKVALYVCPNHGDVGN